MKTHFFLKTLLSAAFSLGILSTGSTAVLIYNETFATDGAVSGYTNWSSATADIGQGLNNMPEPSASSSFASATSGGSGDGLSYSYYDTGNFTLDVDSTWTATSMQRLNSAGSSDWDGPPEAGVMLWLGGTSTDLTQGDGYFAGSATNNAIGLYRYTGGLDGTVTKILTGAYNPGGTAYDMEVSFTAATNTWELLAADAGNTLASQGTIVDSTYTGSTMAGSGFGFHAFAGGGASGRGGQVDAVSFSVIPEPSAMTLLIGALALTGLMRRRRRL